MKISEVMTRQVRVIGPGRSIREAARLMDELNVGVLPVCDGQRLLGIITDRDITVRATAVGKDPDAVPVLPLSGSPFRQSAVPLPAAVTGARNGCRLTGHCGPLPTKVDCQR